MQAVSFEETIDLITARNTRYHRDAYFFVREALDHAQKSTGRTNRHEAHHISGQELLEGIRAFAIDQFGPMALTLLHEWGVRQCEDFGEIVFNMVDANLLAKTDRDSRNDFKDGYDFQEAFRKPFLPTTTLSASELKSTQVG